jgi:hypothetical protein
MSQLVEQLHQLRAWFAGSIGEAFREANAIAEPAGSSPSWAAVCARNGVSLVDAAEREQIRNGQRPTRGAPLMEFQQVVSVIVRNARYHLASLRNVHNDEADRLHDQIRIAIEDAESEMLRAYQKAILPARKGGMFANATAHATGTPSYAAAASPGSTALTCRHCGAPQLQAGAFDCKYCGNRMV